MYLYKKIMVHKFKNQKKLQLANPWLVIDFFKKPVITEKTTKFIEQKKYTFDVDSQLTKKQIKKIFEYYYGMKCQSIKTHRIRKNSQKPIKRVMLCFYKNQKIPIFQSFPQKLKING